MVITAGQRRNSFTDLSHSAEPPIRTIAPTLVMGCSLPQYAPNNTNVNTRPPSLVVYFLSFARNVWRGQPLVINIIFKCIEEIYRKVPPGWLAWLISLLRFTRIFDWGILLRGPELELELVEVPGHDLSEEIEHLLLWLGSTLPYGHWRFYSFLHAGALQINLSFDLLCLGC